MLEALDLSHTSRLNQFAAVLLRTALNCFEFRTGSTMAAAAAAAAALGLGEELEEESIDADDPPIDEEAIKGL
jgi:hypothetical protein